MRHVVRREVPLPSTGHARCIREHETMWVEIGESDGHAAYVKDKPVSPADICATIYACLGIDPDKKVPDSNGQPVRIGLDGRVIEEILT